MTDKAQIDKAIGAHGMWKQRLKQAIDSGKSEFTVEKVKPDNNCDFGKWLHGLGPAEKMSNHWKSIQKLHAEFHQTAAGVLDLALKGQKAQAETAIGATSKFATISAQLTTAMMAWKKDIP